MEWTCLSSKSRSSKHRTSNKKLPHEPVSHLLFSVASVYLIIIIGRADPESPSWRRSPLLKSMLKSTDISFIIQFVYNCAHCALSTCNKKRNIYNGMHSRLPQTNPSSSCIIVNVGLHGWRRCHGKPVRANGSELIGTFVRKEGRQINMSNWTTCFIRRRWGIWK